MKTDYISQGAAAMARLRQTAAAARQIQREQRHMACATAFPASAPWRIFRAGSRSPATGTMSPTSRRSSPAAPGS